MVTNIRQATPNDVVHLIALNEIEYENTEHGEKFSVDVCERWIHTMMLDPDAVMLVITDEKNKPFGYLSGTIDFSSLTDNGFWFIGVSDASGTQTMTYQSNFGSPPFSISSGNADANGYGNFEYAVPSGYYALNTKNLAEYG